VKPGELERNLSHLAELARVAGVRLSRVERELSEVGVAIAMSGVGERRPSGGRKVRPGP
jgi:hypothetical protein